MSLRKRRQFEKTSKMFEDAGYPTVCIDCHKEFHKKYRYFG